MNVHYQYRSQALRKSEKDWVDLGNNSAQNARMCIRLAGIIAANEDNTTTSRIDKLKCIRDNIISLTNRIYDAEQRVLLLRQLDAQTSALQDMS